MEIFEVYRKRFTNNTRGFLRSKWQADPPKEKQAL